MEQLRGTRKRVCLPLLVGISVTHLQQAKESSELGNINLFPSDLEWLMDASRPLKVRNVFGRERGISQCECC